jgi:hypothetical protein
MRPEERSESARKAAKARWEKKLQEETYMRYRCDVMVSNEKPTIRRSELASYA